MSFNLTRQNHYWPYDEEKEHLKDEHRYYIKSNILSDCMGMGNHLKGSKERVEGFRRNKSDGYALLTYFVSQALVFRRLPFYEDRFYSRYMDENDRKAPEKIFNLELEEVNKIVKEFEEVYSHTQAKLKTAGLTKVELRREIHDDGTEYTKDLLKLIKCAELLGKETVKFEMDMLNSYGDEGAYTHNSVVTIEHEFLAKDILYCSNLVGYKGSDELVETGEWVVLNRSLTGLVEIPIKSIRYDNKYFKFKGWTVPTDPESFMFNKSHLKYRNICYFEMGDEKCGIKVNLKRRLSRWLMRDYYSFK